MNYSEANEYLEQLSNKGIKPGLESIGDLCSALGNPERDIPVIHIAGTNGKGSTARYILEILKASGYKVGLYSSPAVFEDREIISINGRNISKENYVNLIERISQIDLPFTRFELETAMAFLYFKEKECDFAVIECGMGGEFDATNVCKNTLVSVFTAIGKDHMSFLGDSVEKIAENKAGIIKNHCDVVVNGDNSKEVIDAIEIVAGRAGADICLSRPEEVSNYKSSLSGSQFNYKGLKNIKAPMLGLNQLSNSITALETIFCLKKRGYIISDNNIIKGMSRAKEEGRFDIISKKPVFVLDGAHNEPASLCLRENIINYFPNKRLIFIICVLKDKEYDKVIRNTCDLAWQILTVPSPNRRRGLSSYELAKAVSVVNPNVSAVDSVEEAVELSLMMADKDTVIISFGSLSHLSKVKEVFDNRKDIKKDWHGSYDK